MVPLGGCDTVLGIQLLKTLGDIKCNFEDFTMEFIHQGEPHLLRGSRQLQLKSPSLKNMQRVVEVQLAMIQPVTTPQQATFYALKLEGNQLSPNPQLNQLLIPTKRCSLNPRDYLQLGEDMIT